MVGQHIINVSRFKLICIGNKEQDFNANIEPRDFASHWNTKTFLRKKKKKKRGGGGEKKKKKKTRI